LGEKFLQKHLLHNKKSRTRLFTQKTFFHSIIALVAGQNRSGAYHALLQSFGAQIPDKSALSHARKRVSYTFFKDALEALLPRLPPVKHKGMRIYAIDGQQLILPRGEGIVAAGFTGRSTSRYSESHMPRGYLTHCYDVLSGTTKGFRFGPRLNEHADALALVKDLEPGSLTIYDRLYWSRKLVLAHFAAKNNFLIRARRAGVPKVVSDFFSSKKKIKAFVYEGRTLYLIKVRSHSKQRYDVFITDLSKALIVQDTIAKLYQLRWQVENSFRELTDTLRLEEWHSKSLNGILQELYAALWLVNFTKSQINFSLKLYNNPLEKTYYRPNFKLCLNFVVKELRRLEIQGFFEVIYF
jgi:hypothetical protein